MRTWIKPFANWIWGGTIIMAIGGIFSLSDRRYRRGRRRGQGAEHAARRRACGMTRLAALLIALVVATAGRGRAAR